MADIFVSYKQINRSSVGRIVASLEALDWSVWWDTRLAAGEHWDAVIEREITAAACVVVVWSKSTLDREKAYWVHLEAHHARERGVLVPVCIENAKPPFAFSLIQARDLSRWVADESSTIPSEFIDDVQRMMSSASCRTLQPQPATDSSPLDAQSEWNLLHLDDCDDPGLLKAFAAKWEHEQKWSSKARNKAARHVERLRGLRPVR